MSTTNPDGTLDGLPEFGRPRGRDPYEEIDPDPSHDADPSTPTSPPPSTSSTRPPITDPPTESPSTAKTTSSSPVSSDVLEGFEQLGTAVAATSGIALNRLTQRRGRAPHRRWLMTEDEAKGIGGAMGRLLAKRVPEELVDGDGGEVLELVTVGGAYLVRNALGVTDEEIDAANADGVPVSEVRPNPFAPAPAAPPHQGPAPAPTVFVTEPADGDVEAPATHADPAIMATLSSA